MVTPGGEVAFVGRMIEESMQLRSGIRWYTSMVLAPPQSFTCCPVSALLTGA